MADSVNPSNDVTAVLPVTPAVGRALQQAPRVGAGIPPPSALLTLGQAAPTALTYDATGLLLALALNTGASSGTGAGTAASVNAATLTGVNSDAARSGSLNSPVSLQAVPANSLGALQGLLAGQDAVARNLSLGSLQADALNTAGTGLDLPSSAAAVLNATGALQTLTPDQATAALAALQATDLGQAAAALNVSSANPSLLDTTGLLLAPGSDSTSQSLSSLLTSGMSIANAQFSANLAGAPAVTVGTQQTLSDVLASDVNVTTAAAQAAAAVATAPAAPVSSVVAVSAAAAVTAPPTPGAIPLATTPTPAVPPTLPVTSGAPVVAAQATPAVVTITPTAPAPPVPAAVNLNFLVDAAAQAANNIASNPNYAAMAATLYAHAAIFRAQPMPSRGGVSVASTDVANLPPPVAGTLGIRAARRI